MQNAERPGSVSVWPSICSRSLCLAFRRTPIPVIYWCVRESRLPLLMHVLQCSGTDVVEHKQLSYFIGITAVSVM